MATFRRGAVLSTRTFDVIVIGAPAAGEVLTGRFADKGHQVAVAESEPLDRAPAAPEQVLGSWNSGAPFYVIEIGGSDPWLRS